MNTTKFDCPTCNQSLEAPEDMTGEEIDCPACQAKITVPPVRRIEPAAPRKSRRMLLGASALVAIVLLVGLAAWIGAKLAVKSVQTTDAAKSPLKVESTPIAADPQPQPKPVAPVAKSTPQETAEAARARARALEQRNAELERAAWTAQLVEMQRQAAAAAASQQAPMVVCPDCGGRGCSACGLRGYRQAGIWGDGSFSPQYAPKY